MPRGFTCRVVAVGESVPRPQRGWGTPLTLVDTHTLVYLCWISNGHFTLGGPLAG